METIILIVHICVILAMILIILMQKSQGGGLGMGSSNNILKIKSKPNILTKSTIILSTFFFITSTTLAFISKEKSEKEKSILAQEISKNVKKYKT